LVRILNINDGNGHTLVVRDIIAQAKYDGTEPHSTLEKDIPLPLFGKKNKPIKPTTSAGLVKVRLEKICRKS
jgi:hypothetical protein